MNDDLGDMAGAAGGAAEGISAVVLAAGESRRMGAANKLLLPIDGEPVVRRTVRRLCDLGLGEILVVLGHEADEVAAAIRGLAVRTVRNADYRNGQMTSVHAGLAALRRPGEGIMICLADQPFLEPGDYAALIAAFRGRGDKSILVPTHRGRRGNPIVLAAGCRADILRRKANLGCKHLIERNPDLVRTAELASDHFVIDIDTEADYRAALVPAPHSR